MTLRQFFNRRNAPSMAEFSRNVGLSHSYFRKVLYHERNPGTDITLRIFREAKGLVPVSEINADLGKFVAAVTRRSK